MLGHDPFDITSQAQLLPGGIELRLTLASSTARRILHGKSGTIRPEEFAAFRAEIERRASQFLRVSADNTPLVPKRIGVELTLDDDVKILLEFPASHAPKFRFEASLLRMLATDGYTVFLLVRGRHDQAVHERLTLEKPDCEIPAFR